MVTSAKELLMKQAAEAFRGRADMPLMAALDGISQEEALWQMDVSTPSIEQIVRHIAWSKSRFCQRGFGTPMVLEDESVNGDGDSADLPWEFLVGRTGDESRSRVSAEPLSCWRNRRKCSCNA